MRGSLHRNIPELNVLNDGLFCGVHKFCGEQTNAQFNACLLATKQYTINTGRICRRSHSTFSLQILRAWLCSRHRPKPKNDMHYPPPLVYPLMPSQEHMTSEVGTYLWGLHFLQKFLDFYYFFNTLSSTSIAQPSRMQPRLFFRKNAFLLRRRKKKKLFLEICMSQKTPT